MSYNLIVTIFFQLAIAVFRGQSIGIATVSFLTNLSMSCHYYIV